MAQRTDRSRKQTRSRVFGWGSWLRHHVTGACLLLCLAGAAWGSETGLNDSGDRLELYFGPYVQHYYPKSSQNHFPWFTGIEWENGSLWELGGAVFSNSYNQPCGYLYGGKRFTYGQKDNHIYFKLTAGALLGYVTPHENKIPVNSSGIGLGIIPAIGYKYKRSSAQIAILSISALMMTVGFDLFE